MITNTISDRCLLVLVFLILTLSTTATAQEEQPNFVVHFDKSSIEKIFGDPTYVLEGVREFWQTDRAYQLSDLWHSNSNYPKDMLDWSEQIMALRRFPENERKGMPGYQIAMQVYDEREYFVQQAVPHIESFMPNLDSIDCETTVYLTAFTTAYSFMVDGDMVIDCMCPIWKQSKDVFLNELVHELFHVGYNANLPFQQEDSPADASRLSLISQLHNEGIATYVGYTATSFYPAPTYEDYLMLEDPDVVDEKIAEVNDIFQKSLTQSTEETDSMSWDVGVMKRAYYVAGAYMAKRIDEELGRAILVETIATGPLSFIETYNEIASDNQKILQFE